MEKETITRYGIRHTDTGAILPDPFIFETMTGATLKIAELTQISVDLGVPPQPLEVHPMAIHIKVKTRCPR